MFILFLSACGATPASQEPSLPQGTVPATQQVMVQVGTFDQIVYGPDCGLKGFEDWHIDEGFGAYAGWGTGIVYHDQHFGDNGGTILTYEGHRYRLMNASLSGAVCVQRIG